MKATVIRPETKWRRIRTEFKLSKSQAKLATYPHRMNTRKKRQHGR